MTERMIAHLLGYLVLSVSGMNKVRFVALCATKGIPQWSVRTHGQSILLCTSIAGFKAMRRFARQERCVVKVLQRRGLPFILQRMQRRAAFTVGAAVFLLLLWFLSSFVWYIEIEGSQNVSSSDLTSFLRTHGVYVGAWSSSLDLERVASAILRQYPELVWAGISIEGSRLHIKLVDKDTISVPVRVPGDVVAAKSGVIIKVIATSGQAVVKSGETVSKGQVLIRGEVVVEEEVAQQVMAEGIAQARVWYEATGFSQISREVQLPTGTVARSELIRLGTHNVHVAGTRASPFELYEYSQAKRILLPGVEHITITYRELKIEHEVISAEDAWAEAVVNAETMMNELLPDNTNVADKKLTEEWSAGGNSVTIRILIEAHEDIGEFVPY